MIPVHIHRRPSSPQLILSGKNSCLISVILINPTRLTTETIHHRACFFVFTQDAVCPCGRKQRVEHRIEQISQTQPRIILREGISCKSCKVAFQVARGLALKFLMEYVGGTPQHPSHFSFFACHLPPFTYTNIFKQFHSFHALLCTIKPFTEFQRIIPSFLFLNKHFIND